MVSKKRILLGLFSLACAATYWNNLGNIHTKTKINRNEDVIELGGLGQERARTDNVIKTSSVTGTDTLVNTKHSTEHAVATDTPKRGSMYIDKQLKQYTKFNEISNILDLPNPKTSLIWLESPGTDIHIGDEIRVRIQIMDGRNKTVIAGGDILRVWMSNDKLSASTPGYVVDHGNGTYTGILKAVWSGRAMIRVSIANMKEVIAIFMNNVLRNGIWKFIKGQFKNGNSKRIVETDCTTQPTIGRYEKVCNFTDKNFGMSWYCGLPSGNYSCEDWRYHYVEGENTLLQSKFMYDIFKYQRHLYLKKIVSVSVSNVTPSDSYYQGVTCKNYPKQLSWHAATPDGYFYKGIWNSLKCKTTLKPTKPEYIKCLTNKKVFFFGDSTTRQWFIYLTELLKFTVTFGNWKMIRDTAWQKYAHSENADLNISVSWSPHELPMYGGSPADIRNLRSTSSKLKEISAGSSDVVVLEWFFHTMKTPPSIYREHVRNARKEVEKLLVRSPNVHIFIKGPHATMDKKVFDPFDFLRILADQIVMEEFSKLQDKVIFISGWDIAVACQNVKIHPDDWFIKIMVHELLSYIC